MKKTLAIFAIIILALSVTPGSALAEADSEPLTAAAADTVQTAAANPAKTIAAGDATPKQEVVYGILELNGDVESIYVVNIFERGTVVDYGNYTRLQNLTTDDPVSQESDRISISSGSEKIYYQGTLKTNELPWDIQIIYTWNGKTVKPADLAGKSGKLGISIKIDQNTKVDETFFQNYALQIGVTLDTALCADIVAENATVTEAGRSKQLTYTLLPGKTADLYISADVRDFEMAPITINGVRMSLTLDLNIDSFTEQFDQLIYATGQIDSGAGGLLSGSDQLSFGMQNFVGGFQQYNDGMAQFAGGINQLVNGTGNGDSLADLTTAGQHLAGAMIQMRDAAFAFVAAQFQTDPLTPDNYMAVLGPRAGEPGVSEAIVQLAGMAQLTSELSAYVSGVDGLAGGVAYLNGGAQTLAKNSGDLYGGASSIAGGLIGLRDGIAQFKAGTKAFRDRTANMDSDVERMADDILGDIMGNGDPTVSFVSAKNTEVSSVQFVLKTDSIELPAADPAEPLTDESLTFWQKLVNLFI